MNQQEYDDGYRSGVAFTMDQREELAMQSMIRKRKLEKTKNHGKPR